MTLALSVALVLVIWFQTTPVLSPDGGYYKNSPWTRPYCMRILLPKLMGDAPMWLWRVVSATSMALSSWMIGEKLTPWHSALFLGLPLARTCLRFPVLTDATAVLMLVAGWYWNNPVFFVLGGLFNEKTPVFGAVLSWSLTPLLGLCAPALLYLFGKSAQSPEWLKDPVGSAWTIRKRLLDPQCVLLPWGSLLAGIGSLNLKGTVLLAVGYAQLLAAQDAARLYQWAFLALLPGIPTEWLPFLAILHWCSLWRDAV